MLKITKIVLALLTVVLAGLFYATTRGLKSCFRASPPSITRTATFRRRLR